MITIMLVLCFMIFAVMAVGMVIGLFSVCWPIIIVAGVMMLFVALDIAVFKKLFGKKD